MNCKNILIMFLVSPWLAFGAQDVPQASFLQELETVKYNMSLRYAPADWKKEHLDWSAEEAFERAKVAVAEKNPQTTRQYQQIFRDFIKSPSDYHVSTQFYSTEWSYFPIQVKSVDGKYYVTSFEMSSALTMMDFLFGIDPLDPEALMEELGKCLVGDELIEIDGVPVKDVVENLIDKEWSGDRSATGYAIAEKMIFHRRGKYGEDVPKGNFTITVRHANGKKKIDTCHLTWIHAPEWINDPVVKKINEEELPLNERLANVLRKNHLVAYAKGLAKNPLIEMMKRNHSESDEEQDYRAKGELPPLGRVVWEWNNGDSERYYAYMYVTGSGKRVGYIYLPNFIEMGEGADQRMSEIVEIVKHFENNAEAMVVDINNNPGGNLFYTYAVLSTLTTQPLKVPTEVEALVQENIYNMSVMYNYLKLITEYQPGQEAEQPLTLNLDGYLVKEEDITQLMDYMKFVISEWESGRRMTTPSYLFGIEELKPHASAQFSKPLVVLVNELDFSCGDFFPAILQDNKRATIFGRNTAGAGGYVLGYGHLSQFGISSYSLTGSLAYRLDGKVIENLGVKPDVPYKLTKNDVLSGYKDNIHAINKELDRMISKKPKK